jgi:signal transduction histidine kinase
MTPPPSRSPRTARSFPDIMTDDRDALERARRPRLRLAPLRTPLVFKMVGAHIGVSLVAIALVMARTPTPPIALVATVAGLLTSIFLLLVVIALGPVRDIERVAERVWSGDYTARVDASSVADRDVVRVGTMFNLMLDRLAADRASLHRLASDVIDAGDRERAALARELHDSTAQRLAAHLLQLGAAAHASGDPALADKLRLLRDEAHELLEEVRGLSLTIHPRVLDDLGVAAGLRTLVRETAKRTPIAIESSIADLSIPRPVASVLYRVAQEALRNVVRHSDATAAHVSLATTEGWVTVRVTDDGRGFDVENAAARAASGIFGMRERARLVDGTFQITSSPSGGTTVVASVPLRGADGSQ